MNYRTVREILNLVRSYHSRLRDLLQEIVKDSDDELMNSIVDSLQRHEQHWQIALARYEQDNGQAILNAWLQFVPAEAIEAQLNSVSEKSNLQLQDVQNIVTEFHEALAEFYSVLAAEVSAPRVRELFNSLMEMEKTTTTHVAWQARR